MLQYKQLETFHTHKQDMLTARAVSTSALKAWYESSHCEREKKGKMEGSPNYVWVQLNQFFFVNLNELQLTIQISFPLGMQVSGEEDCPLEAGWHYRGHGDRVTQSQVWVAGRAEPASHISSQVLKRGDNSLRTGHWSDQSVLQVISG